MENAITIAQRQDETGSRSTGFDYLRIGLATSIIVWHSFALSYGPSFAHEVMGTWVRTIIAMIIPLFFALSGFLVAGSLDRAPGLITFVGLRFLRIFPALIVEVTLSALILGPFLTTVDISSYFHSPIFRAYFLNIIGDIHYQLPGLFEQNPFPGAVNGQLWTIPSELKCYLILTGLAFVTLVRRRALFLTIIGTLCGPVAIYKFIFFTAQENPAGLVSGNLLVLSFLAAVAIYQYRDIIPWRFDLFVACAIATVLFLYFRRSDFFIPFPAAYATIYVGLLNPRKIRFLGDYSYGVYLYGFVIQQSIAALSPATHHWYINLPLSLLIAFSFAAVSWIFVERPALSLKKHLPELESWTLKQIPIKFKRRASAARG